MRVNERVRGWAGLVLGGFGIPRHSADGSPAVDSTEGETELGGRTRGRCSLWRVFGA